MNIHISDEIRNVCPAFKGIAVYATVKNSEYCAALWEDIARFTHKYQQEYTIDSIKQMATIQATREAYKRCGKDPSRYRPSGEALCRRILKGMNLYQIDTLVDRIQGNTLTLGIGKKDEPYEGIGRGMLNIEGMPVYRDAEGGIGTPTSDHERTKLSLETTHLLAIINGYSGEKGLREAAEFLQELLKKYAFSDGGELIEF